MITPAGHGRRRGFVAACCISLFLALAAVCQPVGAPPGGNWRERALMFAESQNMFDALQAAGQSYLGSFLRFQFDQATAGLSGYTVVARGRTTAVFQTILADVAATGVLVVNGTVFEYSSNAFGVKAFNNPTSALIYWPSAVEINVTFTLAPGVDADRNGQSLNLSTPDMTGLLVVTGSATLNLTGYQAVAHLLPSTKAIFRANSVDGENVVGSTGQSSLSNATARHLLALEGFAVGFEGYVEASDVQYDGISWRESNLTASGLTVELDKSAASAGLVALHVHKSMIAYDNQSRFQIRLDDVDMMEIAGLDEVVEYGGPEAVYSAVVGGNGILVLLRIPDVGSHVFSMQTVPPPPVDVGLNPIQVLAIAVIILVLLGAAGAFMLRRRPAL